MNNPLTFREVTIYLTDTEYTQLQEIAQRDNEFALQTTGQVVIPMTPEAIATGAVTTFLHSYAAKQKADEQ